ncbi:MAG: Asp-tRNA(Asn)/Glu-tRNA(Gln) amidotransferase subunit GatA [Clostridiales bacterium]|nr:Asp-tRNA(Asn)/Glu-tRNA(Gln) amidotransferase subunit GatA [Clostridiales bacterium]
MKLIDLTAWQLSQGLARGEFTASEVTRAYLDEIERVDCDVGAYLTVTADRALESAGRADQCRRTGGAHPLAGVPFALKDNLSTRGVRTTCASKMLEHYVPPFDAHVVEKLDNAAAVLLGKLNMDEFAMGSSTETSALGRTRNPRDLTRVPGGSSGGSAAAVAAHTAAFALGSDTGGSIRQPASFCGVVGVKPTYGAVSRYGLLAFASSLDQVGPLTRDVRDAALVLSAIAGHDGRDSTSSKRGLGDLTQGLEAGAQGLRVALPREYFGEGLNGEVREAVLAAASALESMGAAVEEVSLPSLDWALPAYQVIAGAEASSNMAKLSGLTFGRRTADAEDLDALYCASRSEAFGAEVKRRIMLGAFVLSAGYYDAYYQQALKVRTLISRDFDRVFESFDLVLSPVNPCTAYKLGEKLNDPMQMYLDDVYTVPVNIAGLPAISLPCGCDSAGLPIGLQMVGRPYGEATLLRAGRAIEAAKGGAR